jgi:hypothetical protein
VTIETAPPYYARLLVNLLSIIVKVEGVSVLKC